MSSSKAEIIEPGVLKTAKPRRKLKISDIIVFAVLAVVIIVLIMTILSKLSLKHEVTQAQVVSDKVISYMAKQNTTAIRTLGDKNFQSDHTASELSTALTFKTTPPITFAALYGDAKPTVDQKIVTNNTRGQHVVIIYRYDKLKVPFFVRIDTIKAPGDSQWHLQALSASPDGVGLSGQ